jgi:hypothetical protein
MNDESADASLEILITPTIMGLIRISIEEAKP